jgi:hypothetical protein
MQHRLIERGDASQRLLRTTTRFAAASLAPLALSLAVATYVVIGRHYGMTAGILSGLWGWPVRFSGSGSKRSSEYPKEQAK